MSQSPTVDDAHYTILFVNGQSAVFIAPIEMRGRVQNLLRNPGGKVGRIVLDNDLEVTFRCEYASVVITKPHAYDPAIVSEVPRLLKMVVTIPAKEEDY